MGLSGVGLRHHLFYNITACVLFPKCKYYSTFMFKIFNSFPLLIKYCSDNSYSELRLKKKQKSHFT